MVALRWLACAPQSGRHYRVPADRVVYAVGDIHGRCDLLDALLTGIAQHARQSGHACHVVVFLGDYLSRGLDSRAVVERVRSWRPELPDRQGGAKVVALKGNHEDLALRFLGGDLEAGQHWFDYDGLSALAHYGVVASDPLARDAAALMALRQDFERALPPDHLAFLRDLTVSHRELDYCFVHAGVRPGWRWPIRPPTIRCGFANAFWSRMPSTAPWWSTATASIPGPTCTPTASASTPVPTSAAC